MEKVVKKMQATGMPFYVYALEQVLSIVSGLNKVVLNGKRTKSQNLAFWTEKWKKMELRIFDRIWTKNGK